MAISSRRSGAKPPGAVRDFFVKGFEHPWMPTLLFLPPAGFLIFFVRKNGDLTWATSLFWVAGGVAAWTLVEYLLHRYVFHWTRVREPFRSLASGLHIAHHRSAETAHLILTPPVVSLSFGLAIYGVLSVATWSLARGGLMEAGLLLGYLAYEWIHFGVHRSKVPGSLLRRLQRHHFQHHDRHPRGCFGVTSPFWDWMFGTLPAPAAARGSSIDGRRK